MAKGELSVNAKKQLRVRFTNKKGKQVEMSVADGELSATLEGVPLEKLHGCRVELDEDKGQPRRIRRQGERFLAPRSGVPFQLRRGGTPTAAENIHQREPTQSRLGHRYPQRGLSSPENRRLVVEILDKSEAHEIRNVLRAVNYTPNAKEDHKRELERQIGDYLKTEKGRSEQMRLREEALEREAQRWLAGEQGQQQLKELKITLATEQVLSDGETFTRSCHYEIALRVKRWMESPQGEAAVDEARLRAVHAKVQSSPVRHSNN
jgi:hypothetical protein